MQPHLQLDDVEDGDGIWHTHSEGHCKLLTQLVQLQGQEWGQMKVAFM